MEHDTKAPDSPAVAGLVERTVRRLACAVAGHQYRVARRMNPGARKLVCTRCGGAWGMHDATRTLVPWDDEFEAMYAPGGPLDPATYKG
jgi:hypothetical protein